MPDLLLELGTEELPASYIDRALPALREMAEKDLAAAGLPPAGARTAGTPRRLVLHLQGLPERQPDRTEERFGPSVESAFRDGQPTTAAVKFAESFGLAVDRLERRAQVKKGKSIEYLYARREAPGRSAGEVLAGLIPGWLERLPFPKAMRWVPGSRVRFARPLRRIVALLDQEVVPVSWAEVQAGRKAQGHRFLAPGLVELESADWEAYLSALRLAYVVVDPAERRRTIAAGLEPHLGEAGVARWSKLVDEVTNLVEWPLVDVGQFDARYLKLPRIVVEEAMTGHQRYFPVLEGEQLAPRFAYVANRPFDAVIRAGNERVLRARLDDALFFFEQDLKTPLDQRVERLDDIVFMAELGSYRTRIERIDHLAVAVARAAGWVPGESKPLESGTRVTSSTGPGGRTLLSLHLAAQLARTDLTTEVVQEFPGLQGEMGAIYAALQGQPEEVAVGIREAYLPRGEGDALPQSKVGIALAVADKLDTIAAAYATGRGPTGSKDPFMVRRSVLGVLRVLRDRELDLAFGPLVDLALEQVQRQLGGAADPALGSTVRAFFRDRLEQLAVNDPVLAGVELDQRYNITRAVLDTGRDPTHVLDFWTRLAALVELAREPSFGRLVELVERTRRITSKNAPDLDPADVDPSRLEHPAEQALHAAIERCRGPVRDAIEERRYAEAGRTYARELAEVVHTFMEPAPTGVFVMDEDPRRRTNRLALLKQVHLLLARGFADLAEVAAKVQ